VILNIFQGDMGDIKDAGKETWVILNIFQGDTGDIKHFSRRHR
jgi:hypothetical protein